MGMPTEQETGLAVLTPACRLMLQVATEQRRHKLSYHLQPHGRPRRIRQCCWGSGATRTAAGLAAKVTMQRGVDVDILAQGAGKGKALEFLPEELHSAGSSLIEGCR